MRFRRTGSRASSNADGGRFARQGSLRSPRYTITMPRFPADDPRCPCRSPPLSFHTIDRPPTTVGSAYQGATGRMRAEATVQAGAPARMPPREVLSGLRRGIEKESLRVRPDGMLATTPHPARLGSALTHPFVTTDFSESQVELITGVHTSAQSCLDQLTEIHQIVYRAIGDELLW